LKKYYIIAALGSLLVIAGTAGAEEEEGFSGRVGLGYLATSGNSDSDSANGNFDLLWNYDPWRHSLSGMAVKSSTSGVTTAEAFGLTAQSKYDFSEKSYVFGLLAYNSDEFSTIDKQTRAALGYGRRIIDTDKHVLNLELGAGQRWADLRDGTSEDELIYRLGGDYRWNISETSKFTQTLTIESGSSNTYTEAVSAVNASILDTLALVLSFTVKNNSDVLQGIDKTDTFTSISLEYSF
jgi:putative salt-induced outer membrane protein